MKVILNQTVPKVGKEGQVVTVADGFARNYLFPRGLAIVAEKKQIAALEKRAARTEAKVAETLTAAEGLKGKLDGQTVRIEGKVGKDSTRLFGAITAQDVADAVKSQLGVEVDRKKVGVLDPIKKLGTFPIESDLHPRVDATVQVEVYDPNAPVAAPVAEAQPEGEEAGEPAGV